MQASSRAALLITLVCGLVSSAPRGKRNAASEKVESVSLELSNDKRSGGNEIFIEILQNNTSCQVKKVARINRGETKKWTTESDLETCYGANFDIDGPEIKFRLRTTHGNALWSNDFKPKMVTITIGKTVFKSEEMNDWVDIAKGSMLRNVVMQKDEIKSLIEAIGGQKRIDIIQKTFSSEYTNFNVMMTLKKIQDYDTNDTDSYQPPTGNVLNENPEVKIAQLIKSILANKTDGELITLIEENLQHLRLFTNNQWAHPRFEAQLDHILLPKNITLQESLTKLVDTMAENAARNPYLHKFLREFQLSDAKELLEYIKLEGSVILPKVVTYAYVLENLNVEMLKDWTFLETCHQVWSPFLAFVNKSGLLSGFAKIKINSVEDVIGKFIKYFKQNKVEEEYLGPYTSYNIFQAMVQDVLENHMDNSLVGKTLALNPPGQEDNATMSGPTTISENGQILEIYPPLPNQWADLYQTWNMAYTTRYKTWPKFLVKLLIPSVSGYHDKPDGQYFYARVLALYSHIIQRIAEKTNFEKNGFDWKSEALSKSWGKSNRQSAKDYENQVNEAHK